MANLRCTVLGHFWHVIHEDIRKATSPEELPSMVRLMECSRPGCCASRATLTHPHDEKSSWSQPSRERNRRYFESFVPAAGQ